MNPKLLTRLGTVLVAGLMAGCLGHRHAMRGSRHGGWHGKADQHQSLDQLFVHKAHMILGHRDALELSDEQIEAISTLKRETEKTTITQQADAEVVTIDLMAALKADEVDRIRVHQLIDQQYAIKTGKAKTLADAYATLKGTLSPAQRQQLKDLWRGKGAR